MLEQLLRAESVNINATGGHSVRSALHYAATAGAASAIDKLLAAGADAKLEDGTQHTALPLSLKYIDEVLHSQAILLLAEQAGRAWYVKDGSSLVEQALAESTLRLLGEIISAGFPVDRTLSKGKTMLCHAIDSGNLLAVRFRLDHGASTITVGEQEERNAILYAKDAGGKDIHDLLVRVRERSHTVECRTSKGLYSLMPIYFALWRQPRLDSNCGQAFAMCGMFASEVSQ